VIPRTITPSPLKPHAAYTLLAPHYDRLFGSYSRHILPWLRRFVKTSDPRPAAVLDLCCGSGRAALEYARIVPDVQAVDLNPQFVREVRARGRAKGLKIDAYPGDMRTFRARRPVDLVTCLFDSINHLPSRGDLLPTLQSVHAALKPGGRFLFDMNTPAGLQRVWPTMRAIWKGRGWFAVARGRFEAAPRNNGRTSPVSRGHAVFEIHWFTRRKDGTYTPRLEVFEEVSWTEREIRDALAGAGFGRIRKLDEPELRVVGGPGGRTRAFYLAQKDV
jgi:SAM-dependent methyltransferase